MHPLIQVPAAQINRWRSPTIGSTQRSRIHPGWLLLVNSSAWVYRLCMNSGVFPRWWFASHAAPANWFPSGSGRVAVFPLGRRWFCPNDHWFKPAWFHSFDGSHSSVFPFDHRSLLCILLPFLIPSWSTLCWLNTLLSLLIPLFLNSWLYPCLIPCAAFQVIPRFIIVIRHW